MKRFIYNFLINTCILAIYLIFITYIIYFAFYIGDPESLIGIKTIMIITLFPLIISVNILVTFMETLKK